MPGAWSVQQEAECPFGELDDLICLFSAELNESPIHAGAEDRVAQRRGEVGARVHGFVSQSEEVAQCAPQFSALLVGQVEGPHQRLMHPTSRALGGDCRARHLVNDRVSEALEDECTRTDRRHPCGQLTLERATECVSVGARRPRIALSLHDGRVSSRAGGLKPVGPEVGPQLHEYRSDVAGLQVNRETSGRDPELGPCGDGHSASWWICRAPGAHVGGTNRTPPVTSLVIGRRSTRQRHRGRVVCRRPRMRCTAPSKGPRSSRTVRWMIAGTMR